MIHPEGDVTQTVFYFPGCGSERLYSGISEASIYILLKSGIRVILPPPFLCCGYPARVNAQTNRQDSIILRNTIIFSQIREMLSYISFSGFIVSCGTCKKALEKAGVGQIFGCCVTDVSEHALTHSLIESKNPVSENQTRLYHTPCHDSLDGKADQILKNHTGYSLKKIPHCCSEAGTLALSRPDISSTMLIRKGSALKSGKINPEKDEIILTNCPSCITGLGRNRNKGVIPRHIAVELAIQKGGTNWREELIRQVSGSERVTF